MTLRDRVLYIAICAAISAAAQDERGVIPARPPASAAANGRYYALVIGINRYARLPALFTAVNDAESVASVLQSRYGFESRPLLDAAATRANIVDAVSSYRRNLGANDNLLIYYAGHGNFDKDAGRAYWLPVDASPDSPSNWISADDLSSLAKTLSARHVLIVADSCYSGGLTRSANIENRPASHEIYLQRMVTGRSRNLLASGGNEPVSDAGGAGHSVFANAFLNGLQSMSGSFSGDDLFHQYILEHVAGNSAQVPQYNFLRDSGHEDGDFVFFPRGAPAIAAAPGGSAAPPAGISRTLPPATGNARIPATKAVPPSASQDGFFGYPIAPNEYVKILDSHFPAYVATPQFRALYFRDHLRARWLTGEEAHINKILRLDATVRDNVAKPNQCSTGMQVAINFHFEDMRGSTLLGEPADTGVGYGCYGNEGEAEKHATEEALEAVAAAIFR